MNRFFCTLAAALAALLLLAPAAQAARGDRYDDRYDDRYERRAPPPPPPSHYRGGDGGYVVFKGGLYSPQSNDMEAWDFDSGFSGEVAIGTSVAPNLDIEGGLGYFRSEADVALDAGGGFFTPGTVTLESVPVTLSARLHARGAPVEPYLLLGAGIYFNKTTLEDTVGVLQDQSSASAGVHFGGGVNFHLSRTAFVGLETRYLWATAEDESGLDYDIDGFRTMMTLGIKF